jgi:hypothetical protein
LLRGFVVVVVRAGRRRELSREACVGYGRVVRREGAAARRREGASLMARQRRSSRDEERYWKMRIVLEFARVAAEVAWDVLRRGGGALF